MTTQNWIAEFLSPPAENRPHPLWSWNSDIDEGRIDAMAARFAAQGCGGVFVHPRPGMETDYLSPRWFALWRHAAASCAGFGITCNIYDDNSFPSGMAGGHVVAAQPWRAARFLRYTEAVAPAAPLGALVACVDPRSGARLAERAWEHAAPGQVVGVITLHAQPPSPWHGGFPLPDISLPGAGAAFIASTHAAYARQAGSGFGDCTRLVFTDEPTLPRHEGGLPWSEAVASAYAARCGSRLEDSLGLLFVDGPGHEAVRHDYRSSLAAMLRDGFFRPIHDWCAAHGLAAAGHVDEHLWPDPAFLPSAAAALRWMQVPGNDLLAFQFTPADRASASVALARLNLRELDSVARQCGRARRLVESCGGGGYAYGPAEMKRLEDWAVAMGADFICPHLAHTSLAGARKYDWPQTISDHMPWSEDYRAHADHLARVVTALRGGAVERRVLVLMPTTSAWLHARPGLPADGPLAGIRTATLRLLDALEDAGVDYDLGDEELLAELGRIADGLLHIGAAAYRAVVMPAAVDSIEESTLLLLESALRAGIPVHGEGAHRPTMVAGRRDPRPSALSASAAWSDHADAAALAAALRHAFPPQLLAADGGPLPPGLAWRLVRRGEDSIVFLCNPWDRQLSVSLRLPGRRVVAMDTADGSQRTIASRPHGMGQVAPLQLAPGGHALWWCRAEAAAPPAAPIWESEILTPDGITADHPNLLVIDRVRLCIDGREDIGATAPRADRMLWKAMGFAQPAWDASIQFRRGFLDAPLGALPGFRATYAAEIDPGTDLAGIRLAVERPGLYRILVNGAPVEGWTTWFDPEMAAAPVDGLLRHGANEITLVADRFCIHHELAPVYLLGGFALRPNAHGFALAAGRRLGLGTWSHIGRPLAIGCMSYAWLADLAVPAKRLRVRLPRWHGAVWRLLVDGTAIARAVHGQPELASDCSLAAGRHRIEVVIASHAAGMLGPHVGDGLPGRWTWERDWEAVGDAAPPGSAWRIPDTGLIEPPMLAVCR